MGEYKRVEEVLGKIAEREQIHGLVEPKHSPDAKYKKDPKSKLVRPTLRVGSRLVWAVGAPRWEKNSNIKGYALGVVLDWGGHGKPDEEDSWGDGWWRSKTCTVQVTRVSSPELQWMVGHLRAVSLDYHYGDRLTFPLFAPEECNPQDYGL